MNQKFEAQFKEAGFTKLAPIQEAVYPLLAAGKDVLGLAPTGSGKTLAYSWPLLESLLPGDGVQLLILAPSQELAAQLTDVIRPWAKLLNLNVTSVIGGANVKRQVEKLKKRPEVVVGTPGRLLSLANDKKLKLHTLTSIVIDEADELLGQEQTLTTCRELVSKAPAETQLAFFSATKNQILDELHKWFGVEVTVVDVRQQDHTQGEVTHYLIETPTRKRVEALRKLANVDGFYGLVFFKQAATLKDVAEKLKHHHVPLATLSSEQRQVDRQAALRALRKREIRLLLTTDLAARGLDIKELPAVVNYDLPHSHNTYVHRVGRTGRMGAKGMVVNLGNEHDLRLFKQLIRKEAYQFMTAYLYEGQIVTELPEKSSPKVKKPKQASKPVQAVTEKVRKHKKKRKRDQKNKGKRRTK